MFDKATRMKLRFEGNGYVLSTEDLWDIPLKGKTLCLDNVAKQINREIKSAEEESFVEAKSTASTKLNLKMDIVKHIIAVKMEEAKANEKRLANRERKEVIKNILAQKENDELTNKSKEELEAILKETEG